MPAGIQPTAFWRIRINGNSTNGAGFDPAIVGAGTDYTDQDAAQLAVTDLATSGAVTTITSATGGFTTAMIGNAIRIASGTGFTVGTYFITAVASTNSATIDRACSAGAASGGSAKVGGACNTIMQLYTNGSPVVGNTIYIRGQGSNDPIDVDYPGTYQDWMSSVAIIGYNGRPKISFAGGCFGQAQSILLRNLSFVKSSSSGGSAFVRQSTGGNCTAIDCVFDQGGFDTNLVSNVNVFRCSFINSGNAAVGTQYAINNTTNGSVVDCLIKDQKYRGAYVNPVSCSVTGSVFSSNNDIGLYLGAVSTNTTSVPSIRGNTFYANGNHGIYVSDSLTNVSENIIANHATGNGIYMAVSSVAATSELVRSNNFYGNASNANFTLGSSNTTHNPNFVSAPSDLTPTNTALRFIGGVGSAV